MKGIDTEIWTLQVKQSKTVASKAMIRFIQQHFKAEMNQCAVFLEKAWKTAAIEEFISTARDPAELGFLGNVVLSNVILKAMW